MTEIIIYAFSAAVGFVIGYPLGRLHRHMRRNQTSDVKFSNKSGGAYTDMDSVIASERERIRAGQTCSDKTHWH
jgi:hypothetical protein